MKKAKSGARSDTGPADRQVHQYDKILRENMEAALPGLIKDLLGIHVRQTEELPDELQHTKERKPDVLKKITDSNGKTFVLHIEMQVTDEKEMAYRMAEYYIMLLRRYRLPVRPYVIYLGAGSPEMADHIRTGHMYFKYRLITLSAIDYRLLLGADSPEEKMLAILADFGNSHTGEAIATIAKEVIAASKGEFSKLRHLNQLRILSQLRKLAPENKAIMESVVKWFRKERDPLYQLGEKEGMEKGMEKGIEQGEEKKTLEIVRSLLLHTDHAVAEIASLVNVSEAFVRKVRRTL